MIPWVTIKFLTFLWGGGIGYQILKKSETFGLKQCSTYPPWGWGGVPGLLVFGRKKVQIIGI